MGGVGWAIGRVMIGGMSLTLRSSDPVAVQVILAVRYGDLEGLRALLAGDERLANARIIGRRDGTSTPLHFVTDWPGYFPGGPGVVRVLAEFGADVNARTTGGGDPYDPVVRPGDETALHYAASSDDADVAEALIDAGADLEAPDGSIGTPLANAVGYACWNVARLLVARGARVEYLWQAAALGDRRRLDELIAAGQSPDEINHAFWQACHGGQLRVADYLLSLGADINTSPDYAHGQTAIGAVGTTDTRRQQLITWLREHGAREENPSEDRASEEGACGDSPAEPPAEP